MKLTKDLLDEIKELKKSGMPVRIIAAKYNVHHATIYNWLNGKTWLAENSDAYLAFNQRKRDSNSLTTDKEIQHILKGGVIGRQGKPLSIDETFRKGNLRRSSTTLKNKILKHDLKPHQCALCGLGDEWQGMKLVLQLDHINGDCYDNRLENLRFLCPNCHAQTETFCVGNKGKEK